VCISYTVALDAGHVHALTNLGVLEWRRGNEAQAAALFRYYTFMVCLTWGTQDPASRPELDPCCDVCAERKVSRTVCGQ
jgi:hypothetical protein